MTGVQTCALPISQLIRDTRKKRKMTQQALAKILGVTQQFVGCLETGKKSIPVNLKEKLQKWIKEL